MNEKWQVYTRGSVPIHRIDIFEFLYDCAKKNYDKHFCDVFYFSEKEKAHWAWSLEGVKEWGEKMLEKLSEENGRDEHFGMYESFSKRAIDESENVIGKNLENLSNDQLVSLYKRLRNESRDAHGFMNVDLDVFDVVFEEFLRDLIEKELNEKDIVFDEREFDEIYNILSTPIYESFMNQEEKDILKLAIQNDFEEKDIDELMRKYWWVSVGWEQITPRKKEYYLGEIEKYQKEEAREQLLSELEERLDKIKEKRKEVFKRYGFGENVLYWVEVFDRFAYFHDLRKEMQMRTIFAFDLLSKEVAKRFNIGDEDREHLTHNEVIGILSGGEVDWDEIERRKKGISVLVSKDGVLMVSGDDAIALREKELSQKIEKVSEFKGMGAMKGVIEGRARVCNGVKDALEKVEEGDILVTGMTLPDYVPAMKKASAIITDEGGITCHAAIVSRELKTPCIIGTKIATQVLKDGDLIEVDADSGVVRILERAED